MGKGTGRRVSDEFVRQYFREWEIIKSGTRAERVWLNDQPNRAADVIDEVFRTGRAGEVWECVVALIEAAPTDEALAFVAAGPLENVVRLYGDRLSPLIVARAETDSRLRLALQGVWGWESAPIELAPELKDLLRRLNTRRADQSGGLTS